MQEVVPHRAAGQVAREPLGSLVEVSFVVPMVKDQGVAMLVIQVNETCHLVSCLCRSGHPIHIREEKSSTRRLAMGLSVCLSRSGWLPGLITALNFYNLHMTAIGAPHVP